MMIKLLVVAVLLLSASSAVVVGSSSFDQDVVQVVETSRRLDDNSNYFVSQFSLKFQGCHHIQQWNDEANDEDDVRIKTKRLARFRLCPADQCSNDRSAGCNSKFGDYVVDMSTFVYNYLEAVEQETESICGDLQESCAAQCGDDAAAADDGAGGDDDAAANNNNGGSSSSCLKSCYASYDASFCYDYYYNNNGNDFDPAKYAECVQVNLQSDDDYYNNNYQYYVGAYCAQQGGEIRLGVFTDDTCTTFSDDGVTLFSSTYGFDLPYSQDSLISTRCLDCGTYDSDNGYYESNEYCEDVYDVSGKCETRMSVDYPNESSCSYIEGIKIVREDGVIRTSQTKKSKSAAVAIGLFMTFAVLLAGYVYYLRTKLGRAQINLAAASQPLT